MPVKAATVLAVFAFALVTTARADDERPENPIYVSWGDSIMIARGDAQLDTPDKIERSMKRWREQYNGKTVLWRVAAYYIDRFYERRTVSDFSRAMKRKREEIFSSFDPITIARENADVNDQQFLLYMTIFDHGAPTDELYGGTTPFPWQDRYTIENPHIQAVDLEDNYHHGVLEMAHPEARQLMVDRIVDFVEEFKSDGVYVCSRTHSLPALHADQFGFSEPIVDAMKERHDVDITEDPRFDYQSDQYAPDDSLVEAWRRLRGEYLVQFYRELREALPADKTIYTGLPRGRYLGPPYGNLYLDWESLMRENLVDGIVLGVYSNKGLHPPLYVSHREIGYLASEDDNINIPTLEQCMNTYGPLAREHGIKLFYFSGSYGRQHERRLEDLPDLTGYMIWAPSTTSGRGRITHDDAFNFPGGEMTIEAFIYRNRELEGDEGAQRIISKYDHSENGRHRGWEWMILRNGRLQFRVNQVDASGGRTDVLLETKDKIDTGRWVHVATVYDRPNRQMRIYIDGELANERTMPDSALHMNPRQDVYIGRYGGMDAFHFDGKLDELRFVSKALTFSDVPNTPYTDDEPDTLAYYRFEEAGPAFRVPNEVNMAEHPLHIIGGGDDVLTDSMDAFGRALDMSLNRE